MAYAAIASSASGDNTVVAAVAGKKIQVVKFVLVASGAVNAKWKDGAATDRSGLFYLAANGGVSAPGTQNQFWLETSAGNALVLSLSAAVAVGGIVVYELG